MKKFKTLLILIPIVLCGCNQIIEVEKIVEVEARPLTIDRDSLFKVKHFSEEALLQQLKSLNVQHIEIVFAQAVLESGNFNSKLFVESNNMFGMTIANKRPTLNTGTGLYASYKNWKHSVIDYTLFQTAYMRNLSKDEYLKKLGKFYAEDKEYVSKLKQIMLKKGL